MSRATARVFISYAHDSEDHRERVLQLSNRLRDDGLDCRIDQYEEDAAVRWSQWMVRQIQSATYVLVVGSPLYARRINSEEALGRASGAAWEGAIITQALYDAVGENGKFIPVIFSRADEVHVPTVLRGDTRHLVDDEHGYERLYRRLTDQPRVRKPAVGKRRVLQSGPAVIPRALDGATQSNRVFYLVEQVRSTRVVPAVFAQKFALLDDQERQSVTASLLALPIEENAVVAVATIVRSLAASPALETTNTLLTSAVFSRSLGVKARLMRAFGAESLAKADVRLRVAFFSEIVDVMRRDQYDEVNIITPAVVKVHAAIPEELWTDYLKALRDQATSRAFRGRPAAIGALNALAHETGTLAGKGGRMGALAIALVAVLGGAASSQAIRTIAGIARLPRVEPVGLVGGECGAEGKGSNPASLDVETNRLKNRVDVGTYRHTTIGTLLALPWSGMRDSAAHMATRRSAWTPEEIARTARYESRAVSVDGYVVAIHAEGMETANCRSSDTLWADWHFWIVATEAEAHNPDVAQRRARSVVAEITPRVRGAHPGAFDKAKIVRWAREGVRVRVSGWTMLDPEHPDDVEVDKSGRAGSRGTVWEIHPVMGVVAVRGGGR